MQTPHASGPEVSDPVPVGATAGATRTPLVVALAVLWSTLAVLLFVSIRRNDGHLVYALDDPYIHMAMARTVAEHGIWGMTPQGFSSSSSSPIWTALLAAAFLVAGVKDWIPLLLNVGASTAALVVLHSLLVRHGKAGSSALVLPLLLFVFVVPLPALVFTGLEHILHIVCVLWFLFAAADTVSLDRSHATRRTYYILVGLSLLLPLIRYESLFLIFATAGLLALRLRWRDAAILVAAACTSVGLYAAVSVTKGWFWAPNSVLLKGNSPDWSSLGGILNALGYAGYSTLLSQPVVAFLVYASVLLFIVGRARGFWSPQQIRLLLFVTIALAHVQYAQPRAFWMFRYEAYVIAAGLAVVSAELLERWARSAITFDTVPGRTVGVLAALVLLMVSPLPHRAANAMEIVPRACRTIYEQQYQMGRFLREHYAGATVALNDIGAATYMSEIRLLDLVGLASVEIARIRKAGMYSGYDIDELSEEQGVELAIVYDTWFTGALPRSWLRVGSWTIRDAEVVGGYTVTFYATSEEARLRLRQRLAAFNRGLPAGVSARLEP